MSFEEGMDISSEGGLETDSFEESELSASEIDELLGVEYVSETKKLKIAEEEIEQFEAASDEMLALNVFREKQARERAKRNQQNFEIAEPASANAENYSEAAVREQTHERYSGQMEYSHSEEMPERKREYTSFTQSIVSDNSAFGGAVFSEKYESYGSERAEENGHSVSSEEETVTNKEKNNPEIELGKEEFSGYIPVQETESTSSIEEIVSAVREEKQEMMEGKGSDSGFQKLHDTFFEGLKDTFVTISEEEPYSVKREDTGIQSSMMGTEEVPIEHFASAYTEDIAMAQATERAVEAITSINNVSVARINPDDAYEEAMGTRIMDETVSPAMGSVLSSIEETVTPTGRWKGCVFVPENREEIFDSHREEQVIQPVSEEIREENSSERVEPLQNTGSGLKETVSESRISEQNISEESVVYHHSPEEAILQQFQETVRKTVPGKEDIPFQKSESQIITDEEGRPVIVSHSSSIISDRSYDNGVLTTEKTGFNKTIREKMEEGFDEIPEHAASNPTEALEVYKEDTLPVREERENVSVSSASNPFGNDKSDTTVISTFRGEVDAQASNSTGNQQEKQGLDLAATGKEKNESTEEIHKISPLSGNFGSADIVSDHPAMIQKPSLVDIYLAKAKKSSEEMVSNVEVPERPTTANPVPSKTGIIGPGIVREAVNSSEAARILAQNNKKKNYVGNHKEEMPVGMKPVSEPKDDKNSAFGTSIAKEQKEKESDVKEKKGIVKQKDAEKVSAKTASEEEKSRTEIKEKSISEFKVSTDTARTIQQGGQIIYHAITDPIANSDDATFEGARKTKEVVTRITTFLGNSGANTAVNMMLDKAAMVADVSIHADKLLNSNLITLNDLNGKPAEVALKLKKYGIPEGRVKKITGNLEAVKNNLVMKQALLDFGTKTGKLTSDEVNFIQSGQIFQGISYQKEFNQVVSKYFASSENPLFRKINPMGLKEEDITALLKRDKKVAKVEAKIRAAKEKGVEVHLNKKELKLSTEKAFTSEEIALLNKIREHKKQQKIYNLGKPYHGIGKIKTILKAGFMKLRQVDDAAGKGLNQLFTVVDGTRTFITISKITVSLGMKPVRLVGRGTKRFLLWTGIPQAVKKGLNTAKNVAATAIKNSKAGQAVTKAGKTVKDAKKEAVNALNTKINNNKRLSNLKTKVGNAKKKVGQVKHNLKKAKDKVTHATRVTKKIGGKVLKVIRTPFDIAFFPLKLVGSLVNKVKSFFMKYIILPLLGFLLLFLIIYVIFIYFFGFLYGLGNGTGKLAKEVIMVEDHETIQEWVDLLNGKADDVYADAIKKAKSKPGTKVTDNVSLYAYGSPKSVDDPTSEYYHHNITQDKSLLNGWHIYYLDSQGNVIGNGTTNTKDIISLATVMMGNDVDKNKEAVNLLNDLWTGMKPVISFYESEIYHTEYSTDTYPFNGNTYKCTDEGFYKKYDKAVSSGTVMYDTVATSHFTTPEVEGYIVTGKGCKYKEWTEWVLVCEKEEHTHGEGCDYSDCPDEHSHGDGNCDTDACAHVHHWTEYEYFFKCGDEPSTYSVCSHHNASHLMYDGNAVLTNCEHEHDESCCSKEEHSHTDDCCKKEEHTHSIDAGCYAEEKHREYFCDGHEALHCSYGYKDINVYVTLLNKEDMFKSATDSNKSEISYLLPADFERKSFFVKTSTVNFQNHWNGYKKHMKDFIENNYWDLSNHNSYATYNELEGMMECPFPDTTLKVNASELGNTCTGNIEWVNSLYRSDWLELYGVSVDNFDSGIQVGGTLTSEEIDKIFENIERDYGEISSARKDFIRTALSQVGAIQYYWGGKPCNKGTPLTVSLNGNGTAAIGSIVEADKKGRTIAGLDCSGFVGWAYWTSFNVKPGCSTGTFTTSLGLAGISYDDLIPGDIGLQAVPGAATNHIGIYVGKDENGKALWVHCNGTTENVAINNTNCFKLYYKLF